MEKKGQCILAKKMVTSLAHHSRGGNIFRDSVPSKYTRNFLSVL
jgi:hypothetical protein